MARHPPYLEFRYGKFSGPIQVRSSAKPECLRCGYCKTQTVTNLELSWNLSMIVAQARPTYNPVEAEMRNRTCHRVGFCERAGPRVQHSPWGGHRFPSRNTVAATARFQRTNWEVGVVNGTWIPIDVSDITDVLLVWNMPGNGDETGRPVFQAPETRTCPTPNIALQAGGVEFHATSAGGQWHDSIAGGVRVNKNVLKIRNSSKKKKGTTGGFGNAQNVCRQRQKMPAGRIRL